MADGRFSKANLVIAGVGSSAAVAAAVIAYLSWSSPGDDRAWKLQVWQSISDIMENENLDTAERLERFKGLKEATDGGTDYLLTQCRKIEEQLVAEREAERQKEQELAAVEAARRAESRARAVQIFSPDKSALEARARVAAAEASKAQEDSRQATVAAQQAKRATMQSYEDALQKAFPGESLLEIKRNIQIE